MKVLLFLAFFVPFSLAGEHDKPESLIWVHKDINFSDFEQIKKNKIKKIDIQCSRFVSKKVFEEFTDFLFRCENLEELTLDHFFKINYVDILTEELYVTKLPLLNTLTILTPLNEKKLASLILSLINPVVMHEKISEFIVCGALIGEKEQRKKLLDINTLFDLVRTPSKYEKAEVSKMQKKLNSLKITFVD